MPHPNEMPHSDEMRELFEDEDAPDESDTLSDDAWETMRSEAISATSTVDAEAEAEAPTAPTDPLRDVRPAADWGPDAPDGLYALVPEDAYHAHPALSRSEVVRYAYDSPRHFLHDMMVEDEDDESDAMHLGTAAHARILTPDTYEEYEVIPDQCEKTKSNGDRCSNSPKTYYPDEEDGLWMCGTHARYADTEPADIAAVTQEDDRRIDGMHAALMRHPLCATLLNNQIHTELSVLWTDEATGLRLRARIDLVAAHNDGFVLADLKTTSSAHPSDFKRSFVHNGYWAQVPFYTLGILEATGGMVPQDFLFLTVESTPPHLVQVYRMSDIDREAAETHLDGLLDDIAHSLDADEWGGYSENVVEELSLKPWERERVGMPT